MSRTVELCCMTCREALWVGQIYRGGDEGADEVCLYEGKGANEDHSAKHRAFHARHLGHPVMLLDSELVEKAFDGVRYHPDDFLEFDPKTMPVDQSLDSTGRTKDGMAWFAGTKPTFVDQLHEVAAYDRLHAHAKAMSLALQRVRPLGGSELFIRIGDEYFADAEYCGAEIERLMAENAELKRQARSEGMLLKVIALVTKAGGRVEIKSGDIRKARSKVLTITPLSFGKGLELLARDEDEVRAENEAVEAEVAEMMKKAIGDQP